MSYSLDLRERVVGYVQEGGSPTAAARMYKVSRATVYRWLNREDLRPTKVKTRKRKIDLAALQQDVDQYPEARLKDRAQRFGVQPSAIYYALRKLKITRKKELGYRQQD
ncbi:MAG TPA: helix-turn-helix domain-containing protein [Synechococcus sp. M44_DOE_062]|nr:helix-turn-helix domain-containing protein [Synechococcus sp. M44_DOE_062]